MRKQQKKSLFADILTTVTKYFLILVVFVVLFICLSGIRMVKSGEVAVVLRFGKIVGNTYEEQIHEPGLLFAFPYIIDEVITIPTESIMETTVTTHYTAGQMTSLRNNGYVITGDQNIAVLSATVKYVISDPVAYALYIKDINAIINGFVSNAMIEEAAAISVDSLLTSGKDAYGNQIMKHAQDKLSMMETGIIISTIELTNVSMPAEVREYYEQVNAANVQYSTMIEEAKAYRENLIPAAEARVDTLISEANANYSAKVAAANNDLAEFWGLLEEYNLNPAVVKTRVYSAKLSAAIAKIGTVRVVQDGDSHIFIN